MLLRNIARVGSLLTRKSTRGFAEIPEKLTFKIDAWTTTEGKEDMKVKGKNQPEFLLKHPLETLIGCVANCEGHTAHRIAKDKGWKIKHLKFTRAEGTVNTSAMFGKGGRSKFTDIVLDCEVTGDLNQDQVDWLKSEVEKRCPMFCTVQDSGAKMSGKWKKA